MTNKSTLSVRDKISQSLDSQILLLDGAMGTMIQGHDLQEKDYRGERFADWPSDLKGNNDLLSLTQPHIISDIHQQYLEAGANIIETNTFNSNAPSMSDYGMEELVYELNFEAAKIARAAADQHQKSNDQEVYIAGILGPSSRTCSLSPGVEDPAYRNISFDELVKTYSEATAALLDGGADLIMVETIFDTRERYRYSHYDFWNYHRCVWSNIVWANHRSVLAFCATRRPHLCWIELCLGGS